MAGMADAGAAGPMRWLAVAMLAAALAGCGGPRTDGKYLLDDLDDQRNMPDVGWDVIQTQLPPVPVKSDTLPIDSLSEADRFSYGVDPRSLQIAAGAIVRYAMISESDRGAQNVSYESIRCGSREWRTVALLGSKGWERARNDEWRSIPKDSVQQTLRDGVLCSGGGPATATAAELAPRVRNWKKYADALVNASAP